MKSSTKKSNEIKDLNVKQQWILRHILKNKSLKSIDRLNFDLMDDWKGLFESDKPNLVGYRTFDRIEVVVKQMKKLGIIKIESTYTPKEKSPFEKAMYLKTYTIKSHWKTENSYELNQFKTRCSIK